MVSRLPAYQVNPMLDFSPVSNALRGYQQQMNTNDQLGMQRELHDRQIAEEDAQRARWKAYTDGGMGGLSPEMAGLVRASGPQGMQYAGQAIASQTGNAFQREQQDRSFAQQKEMAGLQHRQALAIKQETDVVRNLRAAGIDPNSEEGRSIIRNSIKGGSPLDQAIAAMVAPMAAQGAPRPAAPQAGQPPASQPPANMQPMSNPDQGDPMLIPTQSGGGQAASQPAESTIDVMGRKMPLSQAKSFGQVLMMSPTTRELGKQIVEQTSTMGVERKTRGEIEEKMMGSVDVLARLGEIKAGFKPEFQTIENRIGYAWTGLMDKLKAGKSFVTPEQRAELDAYAAYRSNAADNINNYIKFITGAAMTNAEADRIQKGMPNAGTGVFDGDGPTEFKAKMDAVIRRTQMAYARMNFLKNNGFSGTLAEASGRIPLDLMPKIYDERGVQIERQIRIQNPGIDDGVLRKQTRVQLQREFGI